MLSQKWALELSPSASAWKISTEGGLRIVFHWNMFLKQNRFLLECDSTLIRLFGCDSTRIRHYSSIDLLFVDVHSTWCCCETTSIWHQFDIALWRFGIASRPFRYEVLPFDIIPTLIQHWVLATWCQFSTIPTWLLLRVGVLSTLIHSSSGVSMLFRHQLGMNTLRFDLT